MSGITNPAEEYFKDGVWGWDGAAWHRLPMVWGYSQRLTTYKSTPNVAAGNHSVGLDTPPAGEVWVILGAHAWDVQTVITRIEFTFLTIGASAHLICKNAPATTEGLFLASPVVLRANDVLCADFTGCALNDDLYVFGWGYKMKVAE